ncbi:MAG: hypothetical protein COB37_12585 [Kordiimonadales bacterium]|nr:MAG: hypothetical protein COB37_12585 [Kordiimonadales bacterium]
MPVKILSTHTLYRSKRFFSAFPSVVTAADGDILLAFRRAPDHRWLLGDIAEEDFNSVDHVHFRSHVAYARLSPELEMRAAPSILPVHAEAGDQDGNLFLSKAGRLFQYSFRWYPITAEIRHKLRETGFTPYGANHLGAGFIPHSCYVRFSDDEGKSWSLPVDFEADPRGDPKQKWPEIPAPAAIRGRMIELEGGDLLLPVYRDRFEGHDFEVVRFYRSTDQGLTWALEADEVKFEGCSLQEPTLAHWPKGKITLFNRTTHNGDRLITAQSGPDGRSFVAPTSLEVVGHPYDALVLPDGRLFLVYGYRHDPMGVRARVIEPGQDIRAAEEIIIRDDSPSADTGYPSATLMADGRILVAYYIADAKGIRGIEASILELD